MTFGSETPAHRGAGRGQTPRPWLVTDLVTLGSPLAHADFLMAASAEAFAKDKQDRILPTCPP